MCIMILICVGLTGVVLLIVGILGLTGGIDMKQNTAIALTAIGGVIILLGLCGRVQRHSRIRDRI